MKMKIARLRFMAHKKSAALVGLLFPYMAFAQTAQPDVTELVAYLAAAIATVSLIANAGLLVKGAMRVFAWVRSAIR